MSMCHLFQVFQTDLLQIFGVLRLPKLFSFICAILISCNSAEPIGKVGVDTDADMN